LSCPIQPSSPQRTPPDPKPCRDSESPAAAGLSRRGRGAGSQAARDRIGHNAVAQAAGGAQYCSGRRAEAPALAPQLSCFAREAATRGVPVALRRKKRAGSGRRSGSLGRPATTYQKACQGRSGTKSAATRSTKPTHIAGVRTGATGLEPAHEDDDRRPLRRNRSIDAGLWAVPGRPRRVRADVGSVLRSNPGVIAYALRVGDELPEGGDHVHYQHASVPRRERE
jgi:hypothetical protein